MKIEQISLFDNPQLSFGDPLASRLRPRGLDKYIGQEHLLGEGKNDVDYPIKEEK